MNFRHIINIIFVFCLLTSTFSCKVTRDYKRPDVVNNGLYRMKAGNDTTSLATLNWDKIFTDTLLQGLIKESIKNNLNLQSAYAVTRQAQANYAQSKMAFFPSLNADIGATFSKNARNNANNAIGTTAKTRQFVGEFTASWEADIWGKLNSAKKAQLALLLQSDANARAVQTDIVANVATNYYYLMALDEQLAITEQSVKNWQTTVNVMQKLKAADIVTGAAVVQSEASKYAVSVTIPDIKQSIWQTENTLNLLLGRNPGPIARTKIDKQHPVDAVTTGVPAQLLANRPDVQAAEYNLRYYFELTNVARAYFYPSLTINGTGGYLSTGSVFGSGSLFGSLVGGITQPIFNKGLNKARLAVAKEQQQQALLAFKTSLLNAGQEVSNALMSYQTAGEKTIERQKQLENLDKSVNYTLQLVKFGSANYTEVLTAQQSMLTAQLNKINDRLQQLQAIINLYRALGGGWK